MPDIEELYKQFGKAVRQTEIWKNMMDNVRTQIAQEEMKQNNGASNDTVKEEEALTTEE